MMNSELAVIRNGLDNEDPCVSAPKAPTDRAREANVIARVDVVLSQQLGPACIKPHAFAPNHRCVEVGFEQTRACPPNVEIKVAACFEQKKHANEKTDQYHWQRSGLRAAVSRRQRNARRYHRPVGRAVKARAP